MGKISKIFGSFVAFVFALFLIPNIAKAEEIIEPDLTVTPSAVSGIYTTVFDLSLDCSDAYKIYYTLDGTNPVTSATRIEYTGAVRIADRSGDDNVLSVVDPKTFYDGAARDDYSDPHIPTKDEVDKATVIKYVAMDGEGNYGTVATNTYFVGTVAQHIAGAKESADAAGIPLSVISITMDAKDLFDADTGIYVNYAKKGKEWERPAHIDYFETDGIDMECKLEQDCGIRIQGNYSRSDLMKSFRLYAKADYGKKNFKYDFFGAKDDNGKAITKYKKIILRNGGNYAFYGTKYNDAYWQKLIEELDCETQSSRPCIVYLDGEYWGLYVLEEDYDDTYFEITHGVDKDSVVVYKGSDAEEDAAYGYQLDEGNLPEGEEDVNYFFKELYDFFDSHSSLVDDGDFAEFDKLVDTQSVMDYFAVNVWLNNKWDWPGKNWSMWKATVTDELNPYADNRWRFCFYDLDFGGCGGEGEIWTNTIKDDGYNDRGLLGQADGRRNPAVQCFILCMSNDKFREAYKAELSSLATTIFEESKAVSTLDWFKDTYAPLFVQFYARYYGKDVAEAKKNDTVNGYAGYNNLKSFVTKRGMGIDGINTYIDTKLVHRFVERIEKASLYRNGKRYEYCEHCGQSRNTTIISAIQSFTLEKEKYTYTGASIIPSVIIKDKAGKIIPKTMYVCYYTNNTEVGTGNVEIRFTGSEYRGNINLAFTIVPAKVKTKSISNAAKGIKLQWKKTTGALGYLIYRSEDGDDYELIEKIDKSSTLSYVDKKATLNGVKYSYKIRAYGKNKLGETIKGNYSSVLKTYCISRPSIKSATNIKGGKLKVAWKQNKKASGYQVKYVQNGKTKTINIKKNKTTDTMIKKLAKNKKCKVSLRTYKTVSNKTYYSAWSTTKTINIKK